MSWPPGSRGFRQAEDLPAEAGATEGGGSASVNRSPRSSVNGFFKRRQRKRNVVLKPLPTGGGLAIFRGDLEETMRSMLIAMTIALAAAAAAVPGARSVREGVDAAPARKAPQAADRPFLTSELIFPLEHWHNHASMIVELPNGDLLVVLVPRLGRAARPTTSWCRARGCARAARRGARRSCWPTRRAIRTPTRRMFIDPQQRLWLLWPTILANEWHTALMKYRIASDYRGDGPPRVGNRARCCTSRPATSSRRR